jgi:NAD(P)-dependent dehydrogenase (short-subunit alcohol dehydrogenase family)
LRSHLSSLPSAGSGPYELTAREGMPRGDLTTLEELAGLVQWLASDAPSSLNGETLNLDGGFSLTRKSRPAPSPEVAEWLVEKEWRDADD